MEEWAIKEGTIRQGGALYIPDNLCIEIASVHIDAGHTCLLQAIPVHKRKLNNINKL
jgi:hypothetical protein